MILSYLIQTLVFSSHAFSLVSEYHLIVKIEKKKIQVYLYLNSKENIVEQKANNSTDILRKKSLD